MRTKYIYTSILCVSLVFAACEDMDTYPESNIVTSDQKKTIGELDPTKLEAGVNGISAQFSQLTPNEKALKSTNHADIGYPSVMLYTDANGNDMVSADNAYNWLSRGLNFESRSQTSPECRIVWNDMYAIIYASNNVIANIDPATTEPIRQYYLAQGLSSRAFSYWVLAQLFQFNYVGNEEKPCVPLITDKNMEEASKAGSGRATVKEVYARITADLATSIDLLQKAQAAGMKRKDKRYISLAVAYGLQARVSLTMQHYAEAAKAAASAIEEAEAEGLRPASIAEVSKPAFWTTQENNWMWGIIVSESDRVVTSGIINWPSHMGSLNNGYANYSGGMQINKMLYNRIPDTDVRKGWWLDSDRKSRNLTAAQQELVDGFKYRAYTQVKFAPYNNVLKNSTNANDLPLMRVEEMYLIKAEAEAMSGGNGKQTLQDFVSTYRDPSYVATNADIREEIFTQRRIELWGEGLNWFDVMRLGRGVDRRGAGYPNATMVFLIEPNDPVLLWPIPQAEIQSNPGLTEADQNPAFNSPNPVEDKE